MECYKIKSSRNTGVSFLRNTGVSLNRRSGVSFKRSSGVYLNGISTLERLGYYLKDLKLYQRVISQRRTDRDKVYSLHELHVKCYTKGKEHKKYEFGSKVSIVVDQQSGVILGAINFTENLHDSKTFPEVLEQVQRLHGEKPKKACVDRGYRGIS